MKPPVAGSAADLKVEHPRRTPTLAQEEPNTSHVAEVLLGIQRQPQRPLPALSGGVAHGPAAGIGSPAPSRPHWGIGLENWSQSPEVARRHLEFLQYRWDAAGRGRPGRGARVQLGSWSGARIPPPDPPSLLQRADHLIE